MFFAISNTIILVAVAIIHFYWLVGGKWGLVDALPANKDGQLVLKPGMIETLIVALGLTLMAFLHLNKAHIININLPELLDNYSLKAVAIIFLIRAIGEFRYVGFFKKIKNTKFAKLDTWAYSPLCLFLSLNSFISSLQK